MQQNIQSFVVEMLQNILSFCNCKWNVHEKASDYNFNKKSVLKFWQTGIFLKNNLGVFSSTIQVKYSMLLFLYYPNRCSRFLLQTDSKVMVSDPFNQTIRENVPKVSNRTSKFNPDIARVVAKMVLHYLLKNRV